MDVSERRQKVYFDSFTKSTDEPQAFFNQERSSSKVSCFAILQIYTCTNIILHPA